ncbi:LysR family transcriptional regulator [Halomonas daqingensis]|uniref:LysR family transcriptional regulator n=1 Tax=Billgrantia desiderata TaxID=52021 RepID=UPI001F1D7B6A|nr:LysR family transcriptional regulator [Halomonas desiderata]MCE8028676.1 LysR family transcriptional regulator [Halomonas desiderata]
MDLSLRSLRYFVTTAEEGSITAAARRLHISQPSVSSSILHLEDFFNQKLFIRKPSSGIVLTPAGQQLLPKARLLLAHAEELEIMTGKFDTELSGKIRMACFVNLAPVYFSSLLAGFQRRHPDIKVEFHELNQREILSGVSDARYELALTFNLCDLEGFNVTTLTEIPPHAILPENHPFFHQSKVSLTELAPEPLILMDLPHSREYLLSLYTYLGIRPNLQYLPKTFEMVRTMAGNGLGYGLLSLVPKSPTTYDGTIVKALPIVEPVPSLKIVAIQSTDMPTRRVTHAFVEYMKEYFIS